jgi:ATP-dependent DNA helicase RecG
MVDHARPIRSTPWRSPKTSWQRCWRTSSPTGSNGKESAADKDRLSQALCAFANDLPGHGAPGVLFVGVTDNGHLAGLPITEELLLRLADLRDQGNILPPPSMSVRKIRLAGSDLAVVEVQPSSAPPVRYKGRIYIRIGPRRGIANADDERQLNERRRALDLPFGSGPIQGASLDELDIDGFQRDLLPLLAPPDVLAENSRTLAQRLTALRLLSPDGMPTAAGILCTGRDPRGLDSGGLCAVPPARRQRPDRTGER